MQPVGNRPYFRCGYCETFHFPQELADGVAVMGHELPHECPVCTETLVHAAIEGHAIGYCKTCRGFLAENAIFNQIVQAKRAENAGVAHVSLPFDQAELKRRIACPGCTKPMDTHPYHAGGNAVIDTCHRCRLVWLDAGEITVLGKYTNRTGSGSGSRPISGSAPSYFPPSRRTEPTEDPRPTFTLFGFTLTMGD